MRVTWLFMAFYWLRFGWKGNEGDLSGTEEICHSAAEAAGGEAAGTLAGP